MTEKLLQFIWQFQYFNKGELTTVKGEKVHILFQGQLNSNQGPDFSEAKIRIDNTLLVGSVELHTRSSDWDKHRHQPDRNYKNVVLHVVWEDDQPGAHLPVLELKGRVSGILLHRYTELLNSTSFIPCEKSIQLVRQITWKAWKDRLLVERLMRKSALVEKYLRDSNYHWEETFWWLLARNFGMKVNTDAFEEMARTIPLNLLAKHKNRLHQLEALLMGQAGLLCGKEQDDYFRMLATEYGFLKKKYSLVPIALPIYYLRMRPGNFPTIRLAQLARLVHVSVHLFSRIQEEENIQAVKKWLDVTAGTYWHEHYRFGESSAHKPKKLGAVMTDTIIINTIVPVLFAYGNYHQDQRYKEKALRWLEATKTEKNTITRGFAALGVENNNGFDSQALIELKNEYCNRKRCLDCSVGNSLLKSPG